MNVTVAGVEPKLFPVMMTGAPTAPELGESEVIAGVGVGGGGVDDLLDELTPAHPHSTSNIENAANWARIDALTEKGGFKLVIWGIS